MGIKDLPGPGLKFRARLFPRDLSRAARHGELNVLDPKNQKAIADEVKRQETKIRRGKFTPLSQKRALSKIMASDETATKLDRGKTKDILNHLGRGVAAKENKPMVEETSVKASDGKSYLTEAQVKRNLLRNKDRDESGAISRGATYSKQYGGGKVTSYGVRGTMEEIGVNRERAGKIGFAADHKDSKLPDNSAPKIPSAGIRPLDL